MFNKENDTCYMLEKLYNARQYDFEEEVQKEREELAIKLNPVRQDELEKYIQKEIQQEEKQKEILDSLEKLIENYEIKLAYYREKSYKQGFKDAIHLLKECQ